RFPGLAAAAATALIACGGHAGGDSGGSAFDGGAQGGDATTEGGGSGDGAAGDGTIGSLGDGALPEGAAGCTPPDVLIVLDHTDSMSDTPTGAKPANTPAGQAQTKWVLATQAVKAAVAPPLDQKVAYGLELFPLDPQTVDAGAGMGACKTLSQLLAGGASTNTSCEAAEVLVPPATSTGATITGILDPTTLRLCVSTPIALALGTAQTELASIAQAGVGKYVLLVTDGAETCKGDVVAAAQKLAAGGVKTFVVGFGAADAGSAGVDKALLDQVACAGMTAIGFPAPCTQTVSGYTATSTTGAPIFYLAEDGASLQTALHSITSSVCCGCAQ
ncbi:MAG TPA: vWA domain-containing protein, partial [Polyangiaceae bacterium]|nr:vWA domain-containing protein [Polyangiaceae bacterium]